MKTEFSARAVANFLHVKDAYKLDITIDELYKRYNERHRYFHTPEHINRIIDDFCEMENNDSSLNAIHDEIILTTMFHDIIYLPWMTNNEEESVKVFKKAFPNNSEHKDLRNNVIANILATKKHTTKTNAQTVFNKLDFGKLVNLNAGPADLPGLLRYEDQIFKEFQFLSIDDYVTNRVKFLKSIQGANPVIQYLIEYVKNRNYNIGIYPGSFNPFHVGHQNVLDKAEKLFDKVIIVKAINPDKKVDKDEMTDQFYKLKSQLPDKEVLFVDGNIIEKLFINNQRNPVLIRGLRNGYDLAYEETYLTYCKDYHPDLRYSLILCDKEFSHVSSSSVRSIGEYSKVGKKYIPQCYTTNL